MRSFTVTVELKAISPMFIYSTLYVPGFNGSWCMKIQKTTTYRQYRRKHRKFFTEGILYGMVELAKTLISGSKALMRSLNPGIKTTSHSIAKTRTR